MSDFASAGKKNCYAQRPKHVDKQQKIDERKRKKEAQFNAPLPSLCFKVK